MASFFKVIVPIILNWALEKALSFWRKMKREKKEVEKDEKGLEKVEEKVKGAKSKEELEDAARAVRDSYYD